MNSNINVFYEKNHDGGGTIFKDWFVELFKLFNIPKYKKICEWCSGPGFIGFSLLENNYCDKLSLVDCNESLIKNMDRTIKENNLENIVTFIQSNNLDNVPLTEKWDMVVSNPPHFFNKECCLKSFQNMPLDEIRQHLLTSFDKDYNLHKSFFSKIDNYLSENGIIILIENKQGSIPEDFNKMIIENKFNINRVVDTNSNFYFLFIMRENDVIPNWLLSCNL